ncbi:MAG: YtxH domain-containing protein [Elusimicrobiota bacterium]|jgi:gas vesicle protein|nr:YtxH domain-containing protein [Elusimicrobiota bacterium]
MSDRHNTLLAFLIGGVIGAAVGLLYAPKAGKETREDLKRLGENLSDNIVDLAEDAKEKGHKIYKSGKEKFLSGKDKLNEVFEEGKKVFNKYKDEDEDA